MSKCTGDGRGAIHILHHLGLYVPKITNIKPNRFMTVSSCFPDCLLPIMLSKDFLIVPEEWPKEIIWPFPEPPTPYEFACYTSSIVGATREASICAMAALRWWFYGASFEYVESVWRPGIIQEAIDGVLAAPRAFLWAIGLDLTPIAPDTARFKVWEGIRCGIGLTQTEGKAVAAMRDHPWISAACLQDERQRPCQRHIEPSHIYFRNIHEKYLAWPVRKEVEESGKRKARQKGQAETLD